MFTIYHNPKCSKSRSTLALLQEHTNEIEIIEYLKTPLSLEELKNISSYLGLAPSKFLRQKESIIQDENLDISSDQAILNSMVECPKIIERPIVVKDNRAVIGRPPENVKELF